MTHSPALTLARDALDYFRSLNAPGSKDYETASAALAAIDSELAASADAGNLAQDIHDAVAELAGGRRYPDLTAAIDQLAALSRPAPATTAPVSAQGDERERFEAWVSSETRVHPAQGLDPLMRESDGETYWFPSVRGAWILWQARAQVAQGDEVDARWQPIETAPKDKTLILGSATERWVEQGWYDDERREWWATGNDWTDAQGGPLQPTHWQPLPTPPAV